MFRHRFSWIWQSAVLGIALGVIWLPLTLFSDRPRAVQIVFLGLVVLGALWIVGRLDDHIQMRMRQRDLVEGDIVLGIGSPVFDTLMAAVMGGMIGVLAFLILLPQPLLGVISLTSMLVASALLVGLVVYRALAGLWTVWWVRRYFR